MVEFLQKTNVLVGYKILFALLGLSAVATEIYTLIDRDKFVASNFFSFFTVESNIFASVMLFVSAIAMSQGKQTSRLALLRGASTLYMVTTGIVFSVLLSGLEADVLTAVPWDNTVLHYIMPVAVLVDWLINPPKECIAFKRATIWLAYPTVYVFYSLVRGHFVNWYPYPFLDPANHRYLGVALTSAAIAATVLLLTWLLTRIPGKRTVVAGTFA